MSSINDPNSTGPTVRRYNQRMARRMARRAHIDEDGVAVCFAYNNLATCVLIGVVEDVVRYIPSIGELLEMAIIRSRSISIESSWSLSTTCTSIGIGRFTSPVSDWPHIRATPAW